MANLRADLKDYIGELVKRNANAPLDHKWNKAKPDFDFDAGKQAAYRDVIRELEDLLDKTQVQR